MPALAIAFWRNALAGVVLVPAVLLRRRDEVRGLTGREWRLALVAGALLAMGIGLTGARHFAPDAQVPGPAAPHTAVGAAAEPAPARRGVTSTEILIGVVCLGAALAEGAANDWLALLLVRIVETTTGRTWNQVRDDLQELHVGTFEGPAGTFRQRTELTAAQRDILTKLGIDTPKKIIELGPATTP